MPSILITGTSRGLGLSFVEELLKDEKNIVIATARNPQSAEGLQALKAKHTEGRLVILTLDVSSEESIREAVKETSQLLPNGLDYLLSNAGVSDNPNTTFETVAVEKFSGELDFTITSQVKLLRGFTALVARSTEKKILVLTSVLGSLELAASMPDLADTYSVSRAALNMLIRKWSATLQNSGITTALVHPGWVGATELGDQITDYMAKYAPHIENTSPEKSAAGVIKVLKTLSSEDNGAFFNLDGTKLPW